MFDEGCFLIFAYLYSEQKHDRAQCQELGGEDSDELNDIQIRLKSDRSSGSKQRSGCGSGAENPASISSSSKKAGSGSPPVTMSSSRLNAVTTNPVTTVTTALVTLPSPAVVELEARGSNVQQGTSSSSSPKGSGSVKISTL